jgi:hypothetical protein
VQEGIDKFFEAAQAATAAMEEATPLLEEAALLTKEITPLLQVSVDTVSAKGSAASRDSRGVSRGVCRGISSKQG